MWDAVALCCAVLTCVCPQAARRQPTTEPPSPRWLRPGAPPSQHRPLRECLSALLSHSEHRTLLARCALHARCGHATAAAYLDNTRCRPQAAGRRAQADPWRALSLTASHGRFVPGTDVADSDRHAAHSRGGRRQFSQAAGGSSSSGLQEVQEVQDVVGD